MAPLELHNTREPEAEKGALELIWRYRAQMALKSPGIYKICMFQALGTACSI